MIKVHYDPLGNTLNVWFDDPDKEYISEETGSEVVLNKDKSGHVIGFEKLNYLLAVTRSQTSPISLPVEVLVG